ncbi:MAG: beta-L-arabinofuranosidase domain-containing protein [Candidatus Cryptobacteroides sp.]
MKKALALAALVFTTLVCQAQVSGEGLIRTRIGGFVGERIDACLQGRVMAQDCEEIVEPFRHKEDNWSWQTEFVGKWLLGAIDLYEYSLDPKLLSKISEAAGELVKTQQEDGYIGNYTPAARLTRWDIWGRKYTALSLLRYFDLCGEQRFLDAASKSIDCLISELEQKDVDITMSGNYFGMASCSVLEPVVWLYRETGARKYLDFALAIAEGIEQEGSSQLISKALAEVPVSRRSDFPSKWWSFENGMKAYEMMSCYEGLVELGSVTGNPEYLLAAEKTAESIVRDEINIAGSGAAFECWYMGKERQTIPTYHMMETCVTFTWMQFCARLLAKTHDASYADQFEKTMYNALMASLKGDGTQISKYSPLEGHRFAGEEQCGLHINCCNANGPRGFGLIPKVAATVDGDSVFVNLYLPSESTFSIGSSPVGARGHGMIPVSMTISTSYPVDGYAALTLSPKKPVAFTLALRVPEFASDSFSVSVNGEPADCAAAGGYVRISRKWKEGDVVEVSMDLKTTVETLNGMQAVVRGPIVFARDSRFGDGYVDESAVIQADAEGRIDAIPVFVSGSGSGSGSGSVPDSASGYVPDSFCWLDLQVPMVVGANLEDPSDSAVKLIHFCDYASAGNDWSKTGRYRVWIPKTLHVMSEPYHKY